MPINPADVQHFARRKSANILCGRKDEADRYSCQCTFGHRRRVANILWPFGGRPRSQANLSEQQEYDLLAKQARAQATGMSLQERESYLGYLENEWQFAFLPGWKLSGDGVWVTSEWTKRRQKDEWSRQQKGGGTSPQFRRPIVTIEGTRRFATDAPPEMPALLECPRCQLLQVLDSGRLGITFFP